MAKSLLNIQTEESVAKEQAAIEEAAKEAAIEATRQAAGERLHDHRQHAAVAYSMQLES